MPSKRQRSKREKPQSKRQKKSLEEQELEALVFGADVNGVNVLARSSHKRNDVDKTSSVQASDPVENDEAEPGFTFSIDLGHEDDNVENEIDDLGAVSDDQLFRIETNADDDDDDADMSAVEDEPSIIDKKDTKNTTAEEEQQDETTSEIGKLGVKAAWVDEDDQQNQISLMDRNRLRKLRRTEDETEIKGDEYQERLRQQFQRAYPKPKWALTASERVRYKDNLDANSENAGDSDASMEAESEEEHPIMNLLQQSTSLLSKATKRLPPGFLEITRVKDANHQAYSKLSIQSVDFHPNSQVLLAAGPDKTLRLFQIDGKHNEKIQSIYFQDLLISQARFDHAGRYIIVTGRRPFFYVIDLEDGQICRVPQLRPKSDSQKTFQSIKTKTKTRKKDGSRKRDTSGNVKCDRFEISPDDKYVAFASKGGIIDIMSFMTKRWIGNFSVNRGVIDMAWSRNGHHLYVLNSEAEVYCWDVTTFRCIHRFRDYGGVAPTALAISPNDHYFAIGSNSGIVNVYDHSVNDTHEPKPIKVLDQITTPISGLKFSHDEQILCIYSHVVKDRLRMIHLPSLTAFHNWPTANTPLSCVSDVAFSPHPGYIAIANDKGRVILYWMKHYGSA